MPDYTSNVASAREELRALLGRRQFLGMAGTIVASASILAGCGSSAGDTTNTPPPAPPPPSPPPGIPDGSHPITGNVILPTGSTLSPASLLVDISGQQRAVAATGGFTAGIPTNGPSMALLLDSAGNPVYAAIWDPGVASYSMSSRTTGIALLYVAVGGYSHPVDIASRILALLNADPAVAALDAAIAAAVASDPQAVANGNTAIANALGAALRQIIPASLRRESTSVPGQYSPLQLTPGNRAGAALMADPVPTLLLISPSDPQDGITITQDPVATAVVVTNTWRRAAKVYVYRTKTLTGNQTTQISPAVRVAGPIDLPATENLSAFTAVKDIIKGTSPAVPVSLPSIPLTLVTGTDRTVYNIVVIEASIAGRLPFIVGPSFFYLDLYANEVGEWRAAAADLFNQSIVGQLLLPLGCILGGFGMVALTQAQLGAALKAGEAAFASTRATMLANLRFGSAGEMTESLFSAIKSVASNDINAINFRTQIKAVVSTVDARALEAQTATELAKRLSSGATMLLKTLEVAVSAGLIVPELVDTGLIVTALFNSSAGQEWEALVIRQTLTLNPQNPVVAPGDRVSFTVTNPSGLPGNTFEYDWTQNSAYAVLSAVGETNVGHAITTTKRSVDLITTPSDGTPVVVSVTGYDTSSGTRVPIGGAATTVTFVQRALITPGPAFVDLNQHQTFTVSLVGGAPNPGRYRWTLSGLGSIGSGATVTTTVPQIAYTAGSVGGSATLHVDVLDNNGVVYAKGDATITIPGPSMITMLISGTGWDPTKVPPNGSYTYQDGIGTRTRSPDGDLDFIAFEYNVGDIRNPGIQWRLLIPLGGNAEANRTYQLLQPVQPLGPGLWSLILKVNQSDVSHSEQWELEGPGSVTVDALGQFADGTWFMQYTYVVSNGAGGTVVGQGTGRYK